MKIARRNINSTEPFEYLTATADVSYDVGTALVLTSGKAKIASGTTKPTYICVSKLTAKEGDKVAAILILPDMIFEAELSAAGTALSVGSKVTISADGQKLTATTTSGIAEIIEFNTDEKAAGDTVLFKL